MNVQKGTDGSVDVMKRVKSQIWKCKVKVKSERDVKEMRVRVRTRKLRDG